MRRARSFYITGGILIAVLLLAFLISLLPVCPDPYSTNAAAKLLPPSAEHFFGTDNLGRDIFARCMYASRYTLSISFAGALIALFFGLLTGFPAGYYGGIADKVIMLFNNSIMCFPGILLALVAVAVFSPSLFNVVWALGIVFAPTYARVVRTGVMGLNSKDYILRAKVFRVHPLRIMAVHMFPNILPQLLPATVIGLANMTLFEAGMSYLGLGVQPPDASYGKMLADHQSYMLTSPWLLIFPSLMLISYILGLYFVSEGIRKSLERSGQ